MIADQVPHYPLTTSIVSGKALGPRCVDFIVGNRLFRVYDHGERERVEADPVRYIKSLDKAAIAAQTPTYGMPAKCPVQGDILESDTPIDLVVANRMVRVCCMQCLFVVKGKPSPYLSMVDYANREAATHRTRE